MNSTRKCNKCNYITLILNDDENSNVKCKKCNGKLEIILSDYYQRK